MKLILKTKRQNHSSQGEACLAPYNIGPQSLTTLASDTYNFDRIRDMN